MSEHCPTCGAAVTVEGKTTLHYQPVTDLDKLSGHWPEGEDHEAFHAAVTSDCTSDCERLRALLREALDDQYAQHAPGCSGSIKEEWCACGFSGWRKRAEEAIR